jgi:hypothetical protein
MKLRILGDTVRLRLSKSEVQTMASVGRVEAAVHFGPGPDAVLHYALVSDHELEAMRAAFSGGAMTVSVPAGDVHRWAATDEVGLRTSQRIDEHRTLEILVEKDFQCLEPRPGEEAYDGFANPKATC